MCFATVLAFSALSVTSASAIQLLSSVAKFTFKGVGGEAKLFGASEVKCTKTKTNGEFTDAHLGTITIIFEGCSASGISCTGSKDSISGNITAATPFHLNLARKVPTEEAHAAILVLVTPNVVFKCGILGTVEVKGSVIGLLFKKNGTRLIPEESFLNSVIVFKSGGTGGRVQEDQEFLLALTTPENELMSSQHLESNIFGGGFKESGEEAEGEITEVSAAANIVTG